MSNDHLIYNNAIAEMLNKLWHSALDDALSDRERVATPVDDAMTTICAIRLTVDSMEKNINSLTIEEFKKKYYGEKEDL